MQTAPVDTFATIAGGKKAIVQFKDGMKTEVFVRQLPIRRLPEYLAKQDDEAGLIELACDKPEKWADDLTLESHEALVAAVEEMNSVPFFAWLRRKVRRAELLAPGSTGEQGKALLSASPDGLRNARSAAA
jgi:hypothetical protein